jgi:glyoxylase-like metal-dependent hydrolase (beta-lactamase superfamily II)
MHAEDVFFLSAEQAAQMAGRPAPLVKRQVDLLLREGDTLNVGTLTLEVLHTPGHSPGSLSFVCSPFCVFSGDALFRRSIGRTDLPGGNYAQLKTAIQTKLYTLDEELVVFPGHGDPTRIIEEKYENPFVYLEE